MGEPPTSAIRRAFEAVAEHELRRDGILKKLKKAIEAYLNSCSKSQDVEWDRATELVGSACRDFYNSLATSYLSVVPPISPEQLFGIRGDLYGGRTLVDFENAVKDLKIRTPGHWPPPQMWRDDDSPELRRGFAEFSKALNKHIRLGPYAEGGWLHEWVAEGVKHWRPQFEARFAASVPEREQVPMGVGHGVTHESGVARAGNRVARLFRKEGDSWRLVFEGREVHVIDRKGFGYIANLLRLPEKSLHCLELLAAQRGERQVPAIGSAGDTLDINAFDSYRSRVEDLEYRLAQAEHNNDQGQKELLQAEMEQVTDELQRATGLGGRHRTSHDDSEKIRKGVCNAITRAIATIREHHPQLADHLKLNIKLGSFVTYKPDGSSWQF